MYTLVVTYSVDNILVCKIFMMHYFKTVPLTLLQDKYIVEYPVFLCPRHAKRYCDSLIDDTDI